MIRAVFCVVICLLSVLISLEIYGREQSKVNCISDLRDISERIIVMLKYGQYDVYQICESAFSNVTSFDPKAFEGISNGEFSGQWTDVCKQSLFTYPDEILMFEKIGSVLGSSDSDSQIEQLEYIKSQLQSSYSKRSDELKQKRKLYLSFGGFLGMMLCILLI